MEFLKVRNWYDPNKVYTELESTITLQDPGSDPEEVLEIVRPGGFMVVSGFHPGIQRPWNQLSDSEYWTIQDNFDPKTWTQVYQQSESIIGVLPGPKFYKLRQAPPGIPVVVESKTYWIVPTLYSLNFVKSNPWLVRVDPRLEFVKNPRPIDLCLCTRRWTLKGIKLPAIKIYPIDTQIWLLPMDQDTPTDFYRDFVIQRLPKDHYFLIVSRCTISDPDWLKRISGSEIHRFKFADVSDPGLWENPFVYKSVPGIIRDLEVVYLVNDSDIHQDEIINVNTTMEESIIQILQKAETYVNQTGNQIWDIRAQLCGARPDSGPLYWTKAEIYRRQERIGSLLDSFYEQLGVNSNGKGAIKKYFQQI